MDRIGPYLLVRTLGSGGMGVVHLAEDTVLGRQVALKVISPHLAEDPGFRARFTREAQALAALDSPHVVHVYAHGESDGRLYIATQLVPDGDLGRMLEEHGAPPVRVALDLMAQVASGLSDAHAVSLVHRDIKPANVLLRRRDTTMRAYLSDFGIARQVDDELTHSGTVGTPTWMAPELHTGATASVTSDVYSLGCLLWATLSGHAPYAGTTDYEVVSAHVEQPVPQLEGTDPLTREVNRILRAAMAKDPADRYATAAALRDDLRRTRSLSADPPAADPVSTPSSHGRGPLVAAAAAVVLLLAGGVAYAATRGGDPAPDPSPSPTVAASTPTRGDDLETATTSLAEALVAQGGLTEEQARCTAEKWIEEAGLEAMVDAGFFDADLTYVDQDRSAMTPEIEAAATSAALACATPGG